MTQLDFLYDNWQDRITICDNPQSIFDFLVEDKR